MSNEKSILETEGSVTMTLKDYNMMRDALEQLLKTTHTHEEFIKKFRTSLAVIIGKAKGLNLDMSQIYDYYKNLDFRPIEEMEMIVVEPEDIVAGGKTPQWIVTLKTTEKDEGPRFTNN